MVTHAVTDGDVARLAIFLGVRVVSSSVLEPDTDRSTYVSALASHHRVFIDPDTGIRITACRGVAAQAYVFGDELVRLCRQSPSRVVVSFDQSLPGGKGFEGVPAKLAHFRDAGLNAFAYRSHACFVVLSMDAPAMRGAHARLLAVWLPGGRMAA